MIDKTRRDKILIIFFLCFCIWVNAQKVVLKVGDNPTTIKGKTVLELESTTKGFMPPRMTSAQRVALAPATTDEGLQVYDITLKGVYFWDGTKWVSTTGIAPGFINYFANSTAPSGYLECNGQEVNRTTYAELFAAIGVLYGAGDGSTTFNVPDLRGEFVRGWDDSRGADPSRTIGSAQRGTTVATTSYAGSGAGASINAYAIPEFDPQSLDFYTAVSWPVTTPPTWYSGGLAPVRPRNIAMLSCIKF